MKVWEGSSRSFIGFKGGDFFVSEIKPFPLNLNLSTVAEIEGVVRGPKNRK